MKLILFSIYVPLVPFIVILFFWNQFPKICKIAGGIALIITFGLLGFQAYQFQSEALVSFAEGLGSVRRGALLLSMFSMAQGVFLIVISYFRYLFVGCRCKRNHKEKKFEWQFGFEDEEASQAVEQTLLSARERTYLT